MPPSLLYLISAEDEDWAGGRMQICNKKVGGKLH